ncbi:hypothetical protein, partial [Nonomuraea guangzhouensis]
RVNDGRPIGGDARQCGQEFIWPAMRHLYIRPEFLFEHCGTEAEHNGYATRACPACPHADLLVLFFSADPKNLHKARPIYDSNDPSEAIGKRWIGVIWMKRDSGWT